MNGYNKLKQEFDDKVKQLQRRCKHKRLSAWREEWWALGHSTGYRVRQCLYCDKVIKRRKETIEDLIPKRVRAPKPETKLLKVVRLPVERMKQLEGLHETLGLLENAFNDFEAYLKTIVPDFKIEWRDDRFMPLIGIEDELYNHFFYSSRNKGQKMIEIRKNGT
jgi:hypothetical protein